MQQQLLAITRPHRPHPTKPKANSFILSILTMIEATTVQKFSVPNCSVELSFSTVTIKDPTTGNQLTIQSIDWTKMKHAIGEFYALYGSGRSGVEWFKNSVTHWELDDLEALGAAVQGAIAAKKVEQKTEK